MLDIISLWKSTQNKSFFYVQLRRMREAEENYDMEP